MIKNANPSNKMGKEFMERMAKTLMETIKNYFKMFAVYQIWVCKNPGDYRWQQKGNVSLYLVALYITGKDGTPYLQDICKCICKEMCNKYPFGNSVSCTCNPTYYLKLSALSIRVV